MPQQQTGHAPTCKLMYFLQFHTFSDTMGTARDSRLGSQRGHYLQAISCKILCKTQQLKYRSNFNAVIHTSCVINIINKPSM